MRCVLSWLVFLQFFELLLRRRTEPADMGRPQDVFVIEFEQQLSYLKSQCLIAFFSPGYRPVRERTRRRKDVNVFHVDFVLQYLEGRLTHENFISETLIYAEDPLFLALGVNNREITFDAYAALSQEDFLRQKTTGRLWRDYHDTLTLQVGYIFYRAALSCNNDTTKRVNTAGLFIGLAYGRDESGDRIIAVNLSEYIGVLI